MTVQIDFDGLQQRIIAVPGVPTRQYADLQAGVDGQVFYMEAGRAGGGGPGGGAAGNELMRYRLCDRRATTFVNNIAAYEISAGSTYGNARRMSSPRWSRRFAAR